MNIENRENFKTDNQVSNENKRGNVVAKIRPRNFAEYLSLTDEHSDYCLKYLKVQNDWIKESKAQNILKKIPSSELPECEEFCKSKVGDFISRGNFEDTYDENGEIYDALGEDGILCYIFNDAQSWWVVKKYKNNEGTDGLVRFK